MIIMSYSLGNYLHMSIMWMVIILMKVMLQVLYILHIPFVSMNSCGGIILL
jgi:hypothetical protein